MAEHRGLRGLARFDPGSRAAVRITRQGYRTREVTLVTTLVDAERYPAEDLAQLYGRRWQIETNLRHVKQTLHMDVLRCKTVAGVHKELRMIALVYNLVRINLVRIVMLKSAEQQEVAVDRIRFIDALRWLAHAGLGPALDQLRAYPRTVGDCLLLPDGSRIGSKSLASTKWQ